MEQYSKEYTITYNSVDCYDFLKPSAILDLTQDIAAEHADKLGIGFEDFIKKDLIWVVVRNHFEILKPIKLPKRVKIVTYPIKNRLIEYPRDYEVYYDDELFIKGRSIRMIFDLKKQSPISENFEVLNNNIPGLFKERIRKLQLPEFNESDYVKEVEVLPSMMDHNMHLNNTRSLDFYIDVFPPLKDTHIKSFQVEYTKQCFKGQKIKLYKKEDENTNYLVGKINDEICFSMKVVNF